MSKKETDQLLIDHVKHMRFLHFSIVLASLTIAISSLANISTELREARADIENLITLTKSALYQTWLEDLADETVRIAPEPRDLPAFPRFFGMEVQLNGQPYSITLRAEPMKISLVGPRRFSNITSAPAADPNDRLLQIFRPQSVTERVHLATPQTIGEMRSLWDDLSDREAYVATKVVSTAEISTTSHAIGEDGSPDLTFAVIETLDPMSSLEWLTFQALTSTEPESLSQAAKDTYWKVLPNEQWRRIARSDTTQRQLTFSSGNDGHRATHALSATLYLTDELVMEITIPVLTESRRVPAQEHLRTLGKTNWPLGSFDVSFPELARYTRNLDSIKLEEVRQILRNEEERTGGAVQIAGLSIPTALLTNWGLVLLAGMTGYLLLHVRAFASRASKTTVWSAFPWIAFYEDLPSRIAFACTVVVLPTGTALYLTLQAFQVFPPSLMDIVRIGLTGTILCSGCIVMLGIHKLVKWRASITSKAQE